MSHTLKEFFVAGFFSFFFVSFLLSETKNLDYYEYFWLGSKYMFMKVDQKQILLFSELHF